MSKRLNPAEIVFNAHTERLTLLEASSRNPVTREIEIRVDPLTGETSRILFDPGTPFTPPDYSESAEQTGGAQCPFCPERVLSWTPLFPDPDLTDGRFHCGEAVMFPNLFPYTKHNAVVRICEAHYVPLPAFTARRLADAFALAREYSGRIVAGDKALAYLSWDWNYLPPAGGSILHPHLQVNGSERPTRYAAQVDQYGERFADASGGYFHKLLDAERACGDRWIAATGAFHWLHAYAPRSHYDFIGVAPQIRSASDLTESCLADLGDGLLRLFRYLDEQGLAAFNFSLFIPPVPAAGRCAHVRLVPRTTVGKLGSSDVHVLNYLHAESLSLKLPERNAQEAAAYF